MPRSAPKSAKTVFILSQPHTMSASRVVEEASKVGLRIFLTNVYRCRKLLRNNRYEWPPR